MCASDYYIFIATEAQKGRIMSSMKAIWIVNKIELLNKSYLYFIGFHNIWKLKRGIILLQKLRLSTTLNTLAQKRIVGQYAILVQRYISLV